MKWVLVDINVVLDVLLDRSPHVKASAAVWVAAEMKRVEGLLAAHGVTTIHYLVGRELGPAKTRRTIDVLLRVFGVASVTPAVSKEAVGLQMADFEDAVAAAAARSRGVRGVCDARSEGLQELPGALPHARSRRTTVTGRRAVI